MLDTSLSLRRERRHIAEHIASDRRVLVLAVPGAHPPGQERSLKGPLYQLQDQLSLNGFSTLLPNGITIFPGGVPLYKNGEFVGAVGVSGDGVDQDDIIAFSGSKRFLPPSGIRSDQLPGAEIARHLRSVATTILFPNSGCLRSRATPPLPLVCKLGEHLRPILNHASPSILHFMHCVALSASALYRRLSYVDDHPRTTTD